MATPSILHRPERTGDSFAPAAQTTLTTGLRATFQGPTDAARDLPTEEELYLEIENLRTATLAIDDAFHNIGRKLSDASNEQNKSTDLYDTCCTLNTQWREHHQTYRNLLWRSRVLAGEAQGVVDDFRELVLPSLRDQDKTQSEKQEIIREQINVLQDTSQPSQDLCQEFLEFGRALDSFIAEFSRIVDDLEVGEQSQKVDGLQDRLNDAKMAMEGVSKEVKELGWKIVANVAVAGVALLLAFLVPSPPVILVSAGVFGFCCVNVKRLGSQFLEARGRRKLAVAEYNAIKAEYELEKNRLGQMAKLESTLHDSRPLFQDVAVKLGIFANVWAAITADIRGLSNALHLAENSTSPLFVRRVQRLETMYRRLSRALRHYQVTVVLPQ